MPVASSQYWNSVHGRTPGEAEQDAEGLQTMRTLARNMSFLIKSIALGREKYGLPEKEQGEIRPISSGEARTMYNELTEVDIKKMQEEIDYRMKVVRPKCIEDLKTARGFGDLSENYEYKAAKQELRRCDSHRAT